MENTSKEEKLKMMNKLNKKAIEEGKSMYIDPDTGYRVFTSEYLSKRPCCGNICRHCPYGHIKGTVKDIED
jgi:hypothetical protein